MWRINNVKLNYSSTYGIIHPIKNIKKTKGLQILSIKWKFTLFDLVNGESKKQMEQRGRKNRGGGDESMRV